MDVNKEVLRKIQYIRDETSINMPALANITGLTVTAISNFVNQKQSSISLEAVYKICKHFGITIDYFVETPVEDFTISGKQKMPIDNQLCQLISEAVKEYSEDEKIWFKVELLKFLEKIKKI